MSTIAPHHLVLDTGSPTVSLAVGRPGGPAATRTLELRRSSEELLGSVNEALGELGLQVSDLGGVTALAGPGSFTGLRVGLATALGLHQAMGVPARAVPTLPILARAAAGALADGEQVVAVVDALRGEWMAQTFSLEGGEPQAVDAPGLRTVEALAATGRPLVGFGLGAFHSVGVDAARCFQAPPLAPLALHADLDAPWDPGSLVEPIYFRPPATTPSKVLAGLPSKRLAGLPGKKLAR
ncbi:MAG: tRNA (adenosine(37)-N6)-threonylcarbamoyltransferase complex dimerization subunit type 1 TsaB [Acidobacteriota bacterium]